MKRTKFKNSKKQDEQTRQDQFIERKIIRGLITDNEFMRSMINSANPAKLLQAKEARLIAGWCVDHFKKYNKVPGNEIKDIYFQKLKAGLNPEVGKDIEDILSGLSLEHKEQESFDINYLIDQATQYFQFCQAQQLNYQLGDALEAYDMDEFYKLQNTFKPIQPLVSDEMYTALDVIQMDLRPVQWLIKDLLPKGLTILGGRSKGGKSYFMMNVLMHISQGKRMFSGNSNEGLRGRRGQVLYLALEDPKHRAKKRLMKIDPEPNSELLHENFDIRFSWNKLYKGGLDAIEDWIKSKDAPRLVVIDTMAKVWSKSSKTSGGGLYAEEYNMYSPLADLAHKYDTSIIVITHTTKGKSVDVFDEILGGMGTQGPADNLLVLSKQGDRRLLSIRGKDIDDSHLLFEVTNEGAHWTLLGETGQVQKTAERQAIYDYLSVAGPKGYQDIKQAATDGEIKVSPNSVNTILPKMVKDGELEQDRRYKKYAVEGTQAKQINLGISDKLNKRK